VRKVVFKNLSASYLWKSLLTNGLFSDKIIPLFTGKSFCKFVSSTPSFVRSNKNKGYGLISHRLVDHKNSIRIFKIPHPHPYAILCQEIKNSWNEITSIIESNWQNKKINALHVRKMKSNPECVFCMDYSSRMGEISDILLENAIGKKYMLRADISNCFPSIYSHSIAWAVVGRKEAFNTRNSNTWYKKLDQAVMNAQEKESIGLPIGPHSSNVISDLILSVIDRKLLDNGFNFVRYIDDYQCFTDSKDKAEEFLVLLSDELSRMKLIINRKKTMIIELPHRFDHTWLNKIRSFNFSKRNKSKLIFDDKNYKEIIYFLDYVVELHHEIDDAAPLRYSLKMLRNSKFSSKAFLTFEKYVQHLIYLYPYLSDFLYDIYVLKKHYPKETNFIDHMLTLGLEKKLHGTVSRAIFAILKFNLTSKNLEESIEQIIELGDCISLVALIVYCRKNKLSLKPFVEFADSIIKAGQTDEYWILIYELYKRNIINQDTIRKYHGWESFRQLKEGKVTFISGTKSSKTSKTKKSHKVSHDSYF